MRAPWWPEACLAPARVPALVPLLHLPGDGGAERGALPATTWLALSLPVLSKQSGTRGSQRAKGAVACREGAVACREGAAA